MEPYDALPEPDPYSASRDAFERLISTLADGPASDLPHDELEAQLHQPEPAGQPSPNPPPTRRFPTTTIRKSTNPSVSRRTDFNHIVRLKWVSVTEWREVRFGTSRAGAVDVPLYRAADIDAVPGAHPEVDWTALH
jgi:hypothetical protein